jgi:group I intron endonuclease
MHIYTIKNLVNGKMYVGQTIQSNPKMRWYAHCDMMRKGKKSYLYDSIRKHGLENFLWQVVDTASSIEHLNELETAWANTLKKQGIVLYNNRETGNNKRHSAKSIEKMQQRQREAHARRRAQGCDGGWKRRDGGAMKGKHHREESKIKSSISNKITWATKHKQGII